MNKKGLSYVDWTISFGIFIISLLALFILIGPSLYKTYSGEYLLSVAQQGLEETVYYEIDKYPIFLKSSLETGDDIEISVEIPSNLDIISEEDITIVDPTGVFITDYSLSGSNNLLNFAPSIGSTGIVYIYYLLHSEGVYGGSSSSQHSLCSSSETFECTFGVKETLKGLSIGKLNNFMSPFLPCDSLTYANLKQSLSYPEKREFILKIDSTYYTFDCGVKIPDDSDNVYAMTWSDHILEENGLKESVTVSLRVW